MASTTGPNQHPAASAISIPRTHLIMGLCLPLAVLLGYFLAQPLEAGSMAVVLLVISVLSVPLLMKWHHPLLILCWNVTANPLFLPGRPALWALMGLTSLFFAILGRAVNPHRRFIEVPSITRPLLFLAAVVMTTAILAGGIGFRFFGSERYGGKSYFYIFAAIASYFAFTSQRIPAHRAGLCVGMFFLSGLTALIGNLAFAAGPPFSYLTAFFVPDTGIAKMGANAIISPELVRLGTLSVAGAAIYSWLLTRHGLRGVLNLRRPWRLLLLLLALGGCLISGFRSSTILFLLIFACVFYFEGLYRTSLLPILASVALIAGLLVLPRVENLPIMVQRALSFLPVVPVSPVAREGAQASTEWRVEMWKEALPQVPKYLIKGKGYVIDPSDLFMAEVAAFHGFGIQAAGALVAGDYHNGPLSLLIPFGIFGLLGFIWFLVASLRLLYSHYRFGDPTLHRTNTFLLAAFVAKALLFLVIFGGISSDLYGFLGLVGLSVSLNGAPHACPEPETAPATLTGFPERVY